MKEISCPCCGQYIDVTEVYQDGWNDCMNDDGVPAQLLDMGYAKGKADAIEECIKALAESEDTILSDRQYYTLMGLKEQNNGK